ncbi:acetyltransferase [Exiguobacterium sp. B2(2022)]|uniref:acetyltransferase n=1 Tax=Exiguobacterium sp. B2(2022) TaxID=2992755 RepID=UPI00237B40D3|nr:acetyltransferase [Exiguobacterium sp. B2(2022)]MDE0564735.1 acetyltransferase [Exiguobacterium sp. B2(2022)]
MEWIVIFGAGGHAQVLIDILELMGIYRIAGIYDDHPELVGKFIYGYPVLGIIGPTTVIRKGIIGIGDNDYRSAVAHCVLKRMPDFEFISAVHPSAIIGKNVTIGPGVAVMAGSVVNPNTRLEAHSVVNTMSSVDHDCHLAPFSSVAPGAHLGGNVRLGERSFIGMGATVIHNIHIGSDTVVGAGATVVSNLPSQVIAFGTPAKVTRRREVQEKYL